MKTINRMLWSFILGGAIGGTIALLYAPQKGKYLRKYISRKTNDLLKEGKKITRNSWNDAKEKAENLIDSANDILSTNVEKIVRNTEKVKESVKAGVNAYNQERKPQERESDEKHS